MHRPLLVLLVAASTALLAACATEKMRTKTTILDETLRSYGATIRWGDIAQAQTYIDPKVLAEHPPSSLELQRYRQIKVTGYTEQPVVPISEDEMHQVVQIEVVNVNTQHARSVIDRQVWKYEESSKHWWLTSGLPDISRRE
jgi:hypothetical protein